MTLLQIFKKSIPLLKEVKFQIFGSIVLSLIGAISGGLSVGMLIPLIDADSEKIFGELGIDFLSEVLTPEFIGTEKEKIRFLALLIIIFTLLEAITTVLSGFIAVSISSKTIKTVQHKLLRRHYKLEQQYADKYDPGYLLSLFSNNSQNIGFLLGQFLSGIKNVFIVIIYSYALFRVSLLMTVSAFILLGVLSTLLKAFFGKKLKKQSAITIESLEKFNGSLMENIKSIKFIKTSGRWSDFENRMHLHIDEYQENYVKRNYINALTVPIFNSFNAISIAFLLIAGTYIINQPLEDWIPLMVPFVIIVFRLVAPMNSLNSLRIRVEGIYPDFLKVLGFLDEDTSSSYEDGLIKFKKINKEIQFKNISFSYKDTNEFYLKNINLSFIKGSTSALVGPSGGGKSTLVDILLKLYNSDDGEILVDDNKLVDLNRVEWLQKVAYVSQEPILFNTSILNNLKWFNPESTKEEIIEACKKAQIYDFITSLDGDFEYLVNNNGAEFSGGQKQRIAIARSLLGKTQLLILDEATSQVDISAESEIYKVLDKIKENLTVIIVAHRLSALKNVDNIIIIENGTVASKGTHNELLEFSNFYSDSLKKQDIN